MPTTTMTTSDLYSLDLNAARREAEIPDGITLTQRDETFTLPAELPLDIFDPLLSSEFSLTGLLKQLLESSADNYSEALVDILTARPDLPKETVAAVREVLSLLFGEEHFDRFVATRPSVPDYGRLITGLVRVYGVGLGEAFKSLSTSLDVGATSKETSESTPGSTPEPFGVGEEPDPASLESAD